MKTAVQHAPLGVRVEDVPESLPKPGEVKVKIAYCGTAPISSTVLSG